MARFANLKKSYMLYPGPMGHAPCSRSGITLSYVVIDLEPPAPSPHSRRTLTLGHGVTWYGIGIQAALSNPNTR